MTWRLTAIVSGGQTGADRGGLDAAIALDLGWGGWAPHGWLAEDGEIPEIYRARMKESVSADYGVRTRLNVQDSDGTVLLTTEQRLTGGSLYTANAAGRQRKPFLHLVLPDGATLPEQVAADVRAWIVEARISVLNVAGPRETKSPGIQLAVRDALVWIFEDAPLQMHTCVTGFQCQACERVLCWDCEKLLPADHEMKTAVRWCKGATCVLAEQRSNYGAPSDGIDIKLRSFANMVNPEWYGTIPLDPEDSDAPASTFAATFEREVTAANAHADAQDGLLASAAAGGPFYGVGKPAVDPAAIVGFDDLQKLRAVSDPTEEQKIERDRLIYGTGYARHHPDGRLEHIPATEVISTHYDNPQPKNEGT